MKSIIIVSSKAMILEMQEELKRDYIKTVTDLFSLGRAITKIKQLWGKDLYFLLNTFL